MTYVFPRLICPTPEALLDQALSGLTAERIRASMREAGLQLRAEGSELSPRLVRGNPPSPGAAVLPTRGPER